MKRWSFAVLAGVLSACSSGSHGSAGAPSGDPIAFPLFDGASVLSAHQWHRTITVQPGVADHAVFAQGAGTYDGHDVVAGTQAFMPALETWLGDLTAHPPQGYVVAVTGNGIDSVRTHTRQLGLDFEAFTNMESGKRHGVVVMVVDPQVLNDKAGSMLQLIGRLKYAPKIIRDPIDAQIRRQTGFSLDDAINPDTPVGAAFAALTQLQDFGGRGIVLIDAVKH
ncbi:MAG TPA: hypothetical protein VKR56_09990 [Candidatus Cybelea sp.]|nr:hypothetical protein [Candidatus Cybelea sp.]